MVDRDEQTRRSCLQHGNNEPCFPVDGLRPSVPVPWLTGSTTVLGTSPARHHSELLQRGGPLAGEAASRIVAAHGEGEATSRCGSRRWKEVGPGAVEASQRRRRRRKGRSPPDPPCLRQGARATPDRRPAQEIILESTAGPDPSRASGEEIHGASRGQRRAGDNHGNVGEERARGPRRDGEADARDGGRWTHLACGKGLRAAPHRRQPLRPLTSMVLSTGCR